MKKGKLYQKLASSFAWLLAVALLIPLCVGAATTESLNKDYEKCSITVNFTPGSTAFRLYRVASIDEQTKFTLVDPFTNYSVEVNGLDTSGYSDLALTLGNYATSDDLTPTATGITDETGAYKFENLETGMYLLVGSTLTEAGTYDGKTGTWYYSPQASIIVVPTWPVSGDVKYDYEPTVTVKYGEYFVPDDEDLDEEKENLKVTKQWDYSDVTDDEEARKDQPSEVSVTILCDGEVYSDGETTYSDVKLNESNNWSIELNDLEAGHTYSAIENDVDSNYTISISQTSNVITLTNTHNKTYDDKNLEDDDPDSTTEAPESTTEAPESTTEDLSRESTDVYIEDDDPDDPDDPSTTESTESTSSTSSTTTTESSTKLPQTGQLWWPVPILALVGLVLFGAGGFRRSRSEKKEK